MSKIIVVSSNTVNKKSVLFFFPMQVKVLRNQLWMLHGAFAAHSLSCQNFLEKNIQEAGEHLNNVSTDVPSFLEES